MKTPRASSSEGEGEHRSFVSAHESARANGYTGTVEVFDDGVTGGTVFLNGVVVYARHRRDASKTALESLLSEDGIRSRKLPSTPDAVRMFRTYLRYISDDGLLTAEPLNGATVEPYEVEGVIFEGVRNSTEIDTFSTRSSMSARADVQRSFFPEGRRTSLAPDVTSLRRHIDENGVTGYAVGENEIVTFRDGEPVDKKRTDAPTSVRADVGVGGGWVVVNTGAKDGDAGRDDSNSLLSRIL